MRLKAVRARFMVHPVGMVFRNDVSVVPAHFLRAGLRTPILLAWCHGAPAHCPLQVFRGEGLLDRVPVDRGDVVLITVLGGVHVVGLGCYCGHVVWVYTVLA